MSRSTTERGYGTAHQRERARHQRRIDRGEHVVCWRCGRAINPGMDWDLGHDDHDRSVTRGPECLPCNRGTTTRRPPRARAPEQHPGIVRD